MAIVLSNAASFINPISSDRHSTNNQSIFWKLMNLPLHSMNHKITENPDPFREARKDKGVLPCEFRGETIPMILRHEDLRRAAANGALISSATKLETHPALPLVR